jgi:hypothetical protein
VPEPAGSACIDSNTVVEGVCMVADIFGEVCTRDVDWQYIISISSSQVQNSEVQ